MTIHTIYIAVEAIDFIGFFFIIGLLTIRSIILPKAFFSHCNVSMHWITLLRLNLTAITISAIAILALRTISMSGLTGLTAIQMLPTVLQKTHFGHVWSLHLILLVVAWLVALATNRLSTRSLSWLLSCIFILQAFSYSASSHAADQGDFTLSEFNDWLHMLATAIWGGGIIVSSCFLFPTLLRFQSDEIALPSLFVHLSRLFLFTVPIVIITGLLNVIMHTQNYSRLISDSYGHILLVKLSLVALMLLVGVINRYRLIAAFPQGSQATQATVINFLNKLRQMFMLDSVLVIFVLIAATILKEAMPA